MGSSKGSLSPCALTGPSRINLLLTLEKTRNESTGSLWSYKCQAASKIVFHMNVKSVNLRHVHKGKQAHYVKEINSRFEGH